MVFKTLILCCIIAVFLSCEKEPEKPSCGAKPTYNYLPPYDTIIAELAKLKTVDFSSDHGLSESMGISYDTDINEEWEDRGNDCSKYNSQQTYIDYTSSMYLRRFRISLKQLRENLLFTIEDGSQNNKYERQYMALSFSLTDSFTYPIKANYGSHLNETKYSSQIKTLDSLLVDDKMLYKVIEITNSLIVTEGNATEITHFYFDLKNGIVMYKQKNGVIWETDLQ